MVKPFSSKSRFGFTMIELIFAIVIIGITVVSLPMMTQATSRGIDNNFVQEAIFAASTEVMQAMSYRWDLNSAENNTPGELSRVIDINGDCSAISKRPGHIVRSCYSDLSDVDANISANTSDPLIENLNNAVKTDSNVFTGIDGSGYGYKKAYTQTTTVSMSSFGGVNNGNFKHIETTITDPVNETQVVLEAFSANIGEVEPLKRSF
ncbi:MAG: type II secretion system protein [Helicobacteraceae bacterium]|nr:type II secretion system protein [Helicobacteraceae bacterium]